MKSRTSVWRGLAFTALGALTFAACDDKDPVTPIEEDPVVVSVTPSSMNLTVGQTGNAIATVQNATTNQGINWRSANPAVATVAPATGGQVTITAVGPGNTVITALSAQDTTARAGIAVTVTASPVNITLAPSDADINIGQTLALVATVTGSTNTGVTYRSSATGVATVSTAGVVTGVASGTAVITALANADTTKKATAVIRVAAASPVVITLTPTTGAVGTGQTLQFVATVTGSTNTGVTWRSSAPAIATVSTTGLATGVSAGTAVITAIANADTTKRQSATLTVNPPPPEASISIQSVTTNPGGTPVNPANVAGLINVLVNVSAVPENQVQRAAILVDGVEICAQVFTPVLGTTQSVAVINCTVNTAELNAQGQPRFINGPHTLRAVAFRTNGDTAATATFQTLTFNNANQVNGVVTFDNTLDDTDNDPDNASEVDATANTWFGGSATVALTTAIFQGNAVANISLTLDLNCNGAADGGEPTRTVAVANGTGSITWSEANNMGAATPGIDDLSDMTVCFLVSNARDAGGATVFLPAGAGGGNVTTAGTALNAVVGPGQNVFAIDNVPAVFPGPVTLPPSVLANLNWAGLNTTFSTSGGDAIANSVAVDAGVGNVATTFWAVDATLPAGTQAELAAAVAAGTQITTSSTLPPSSTFNNQYRLVVRAIDGLGNVVYTAGGTFGVDLTRPTTAVNAATTTADMSINPAAPLQVDTRVSDTFSGSILVRSRVFLHNVLEVDTNADTDVQCIDGAGNVTVVPGSGVCATFDVALVDLPGPIEQGVVPIAPLAGVANEGYIQSFSWTVDRAGNASADTVKRTVLIDVTVPGGMINSFSVVIATGSVSLDGTIQENVDIDQYDLRYNFPALASVPDQLPFTAAVDVDGFGLPLTGVLNVTGQNAVLIREVFDGVATIVPNQVGFGAWDVARNFGFIFQGLAFAGGDGTGLVQSDVFAVNSFDVDVTAAGANTVTLDRSSGPTSTNVDAIVTVGPTASNPIATVFFYHVHPGADLAFGTGDDFNVLLGSRTAAQANVVTGVSERTFTFSFNVTATVGSPFPIDATTYPVFAVAADRKSVV